MRRIGFAVGVMFFLFGAISPLAPAGADEPAPATLLEDITVVGSPIIEVNEVDRYAGEKTTVTETQIRDLNAQDLGTALRRTPGVNISRYDMVGSFGGSSGGAVFIRGQGASRPGAEIKTLVDGVPMYMSVWNHPLLDLMPVDAAASIEVHKSPQPQVFGNAFGIINLVPKKQSAEGFTTRAELAGGSYDTYIAKAEHGGRTGSFDYYLGGGYRSSAGHRDNADGEIQNLYGRLGYQFNGCWGLSYFTLLSDNSADDPGVEGAASTLRQGRYETRAWLSVLSLENDLDAADGFIKLYDNAGEGNWLNHPIGAGVQEDLFNDFSFYGVKARETFRVWPGGEVIAGLDWDVTDGEYDQRLSNGRRDRWKGHDFAILSPYAAVSHQFGSKEGWYVTPSAGVRYYDNSDFDNEWSPHAGVIVGYRHTQLHAGYSRGVVYPGLDVVVFSEKVIPMLGSSWKDLSAETVDHYEVGLSHRFGPLAAADFTFFCDDGQDRYVIVPPPPPPPAYANIEQYKIRGIEATASIFPLDNLSLFTGLTYLNTDPSDLPYKPKWTLSAGLNLRFLRDFKLSLDCQYIDKMRVDAWARNSTAVNKSEVDGYFLVNGKLSYAFLTVEHLKATVFVAGENLTDTDYEYMPGYPMPGATGMVGVNLEL